MLHDRHHEYYTATFGGYTTIWDRLYGTMRPKFERDFAKLAERRRAPEAMATPAT